MTDENDQYLHQAKCFIGGAWVEPATGQQLELIDPSNGKILSQIADGDERDIDAAVCAAQAALQGGWGRYTALERGRVMAKISAAVLAHADRLAQLEAMDVGKPLTQAKADVIALARYFEFYAGAVDKIHGQTIPFQDGYTVYSLREPHGVTGHIIPWNYPMQIIGRSIGAALAMGNACVLKPAEEACLTALAFAQIAHDCGLPDGALNVVPGLGRKAGAALSAHPRVHHLSFTGSVGVGAQVQASAATNTVPVTLELGGKSPQLVFDDADIERALPFLVNAGIQNAGQTCSASSRILVQRGVFDKVCDLMAARYRQLRVGPALDDLDVGPVVSKRQQQIVQSFLDNAGDVEAIGKAKLGDDLPQGGAYVAPTLFAPVSPQHDLAQKEIFGPVQVIIPFDDDDHAIELANGTEFGLVASVWSENGGRQMRLAKRLHAGQVFLNNYGAAGGVELPFGGVGKSGHGREKGFEALYGFSSLKTVAAWHG